MRYLRQEDARMRLQGTVCRYKGKPTYIGEINADLIATVYPLRAVLTKKEGERINVSTDPDLDISSPPLGYINTDPKSNSIIYFSRRADRQQKQGMSEGNTSAYAFERVESIRWRLLDYCTPISDMIENKYPSFGDALKCAFSGHPKAFHRRLAVVPTKSAEVVSITFSRTLIAFLFRNEGIAYLHPSFNTPFYKEILTRNGIKTESFHGLDFEQEAF